MKKKIMYKTAFFFICLSTVSNDITYHADSKGGICLTCRPHPLIWEGHISSLYQSLVIHYSDGEDPCEEAYLSETQLGQWNTVLRSLLEACLVWNQTECTHVNTLNQFRSIQINGSGLIWSPLTNCTLWQPCATVRWTVKTELSPRGWARHLLYKHIL